MSTPPPEGPEDSAGEQSADRPPGLTPPGLTPPGGPPPAGPPPGWTPPPAGPPPGWTPPPYPYGPPQYLPPPVQNKGLTAVGFWSAVGGVFATIPLSVLLIIASDGALPQALAAGIFAGIVFLGGGALCFVKSSGARGFAVGMMIGWATLSIVSAGFCTGLTDLHLG